MRGRAVVEPIQRFVFRAPFFLLLPFLVYTSPILDLPYLTGRDMAMAGTGNVWGQPSSSFYLNPSIVARTINEAPAAFINYSFLPSLAPYSRYNQRLTSYLHTASICGKIGKIAAVALQFTLDDVATYRVWAGNTPEYQKSFSSVYAITLAAPVTKNLIIGGSTKLVNSDYHFSSSRAMAKVDNTINFDFGMVYHICDWAGFGASIKNVGPPYTFNFDEVRDPPLKAYSPLKVTLGAGLKRHPLPAFLESYTAEIDLELVSYNWQRGESESVVYKDHKVLVALESEFADVATVRFGLRPDPGYNEDPLSAGIGIDFTKYAHLDFGITFPEFQWSLSIETKIYRYNPND